MQFDSLRAFPYPVLRPDVDDYTDGEIQALVDMKASDDGLTIRASVQFALSVKEIAELIDQGKASYAVVFECRDTYFRHAQLSKVPVFEVPFESGSLRGEVQIKPYIVSVSDISDFKCKLINPEFGEGPFSFFQGAVLAVDRPQVTFIDRDVFSPISSVFSLVQDDALTGHEWHVKLQQDKVQIVVSPELKASISVARGHKKNKAILLNSIYFATVMQCISHLKKDAAEYSSYRWAQVIQNKCHNLHVDLKNHDEYLAAQKLMKTPFGLIDTYIFKEAA